MKKSQSAAILNPATTSVGSVVSSSSRRDQDVPLDFSLKKRQKKTSEVILPVSDTDGESIISLLNAGTSRRREAERRHSTGAAPPELATIISKGPLKTLLEDRIGLNSVKSAFEVVASGSSLNSASSIGTYYSPIPLSLPGITSSKGSLLDFPSSLTISPFLSSFIASSTSTADELDIGNNMDFSFDTKSIRPFKTSNTLDPISALHLLPELTKENTNGGSLELQAAVAANSLLAAAQYRQFLLSSARRNNNLSAGLNRFSPNSQHISSSKIRPISASGVPLLGRSQSTSAFTPSIQQEVSSTTVRYPSNSTMPPEKMSSLNTQRISSIRENSNSPTSTSDLYRYPSSKVVAGNSGSFNAAGNKEDDSDETSSSVGRDDTAGGSGRVALEVAASRRRGQSLPEEMKDEAYWERRRKNNEAAKRSRDARRVKEDETAIRAALLEQENMKLRIEVAALKGECEKLRHMLFSA